MLWEVKGADRTTGVPVHTSIEAETEAEAVKIAGASMLIESARAPRLEARRRFWMLLAATVLATGTVLAIRGGRGSVAVEAPATVDASAPTPPAYAAPVQGAPAPVHGWLGVSADRILANVDEFSLVTSSAESGTLVSTWRGNSGVTVITTGGPVNVRDLSVLARVRPDVPAGPLVRIEAQIIMNACPTLTEADAAIFLNDASHAIRAIQAPRQSACTGGVGFVCGASPRRTAPCSRF